MLGMKTNVAEMTKELKQSIANLADDKEATRALKSEADLMKHEYIKQVEEFRTVCRKVGVSTSTLSCFHKIFTGIKSVCVLLELQFDDRSEELFRDFAPHESAPTAVVATAKVDNTFEVTAGLTISNSISSGNGMSNGNGQKNDPPRPVSAAESLPKSAAAAPPTKRGWGSTANQTTKQPALSLVDIQKEQKQSA